MPAGLVEKAMLEAEWLDELVRILPSRFFLGAHNNPSLALGFLTRDANPSDDP